MEAPDYVLADRSITTQREWRRLKRRELRAAIKAVETLLIGSGFTPRGSQGERVPAIVNQLEALRQAWCPRKWGS